MRTKVFVSYSHIDREWVDRLKMHLVVLERRGFVDVWSDMRIAVGAGWQEEIESALTTARVAVLLVSPSFLASDYVWKQEMPRIMAHQKAGMRVVPIIARPCAWRLCEELVTLQARPADGRPLSIGSDAQVDLDLAAFVYELAGLVQALPEAIATDEWERLTARPQAVPRSSEASVREERSSAPGRPMTLAAVWRGRYAATGARMTLRIDGQMGDRFTGRIEYEDDGVVTEITGRVWPDAQVLQRDDAWRSLGNPTDQAVTFEERRVITRGRRPIDLNGEYRAFVDSEHMAGGWFSGGSLIGVFAFDAERSARGSAAGVP